MNSGRNYLLPVAAFALLGAGIAPAEAAATRYQQTNLVSDVAMPGVHTDSNLVNAWGIVFNPTAFVCIADNGTGLSTLYDGAGNPAPPPPAPQPLVVQIPSGNNVYDPRGAPTGIVFNASNDFMVTNGTSKGPSRFIFATEEGIIAGWAPTVDGTHALFALQTPGAVYKGLALTGNGSGNFLYAADLFGGKIDVFDASFNPVNTSGGFIDPALPAGFAPFNITAIQGDLYVTFAFHKAGDTDETAGPGLGIVDVFDADGHLIRRVATRGKLNAPGRRARAGIVRQTRERSAGRQFRRRRDQRVRRAQRDIQRPVARRERQAAEDRRPVGAGLRQWRCGAADERPVLHGGAER